MAHTDVQHKSRELSEKHPVDAQLGMQDVETADAPSYNHRERAPPAAVHLCRDVAEASYNPHQGIDHVHITHIAAT